MSKLTRTDPSQSVMSLTIGTDKTVAENKISIPNIFQTNRDISRIFEDWYSQQRDPKSADSLIQKITLLSLNPASLLAALLFLSYQHAEDFPKDFEKKIKYKYNLDSL